MQPLDPPKTALLVIDCQNDFCHPDGTSGRGGVPLQYIHTTLPALQRFIPDVRATGVLVIFVRTLHSEWTDSAVWNSRSLRAKGPICAPGSWGAEFYQIGPAPKDFIVTKHRYSAFIGTDLELVLRSHGIENLLCTGFITNVCVESTLRDGFMLNFYTILVEDCCAAPTLEEHHAAVYNAQRYFGTAGKSDAVLAALRIGKH